ncbi:unnamed protein product [Rotaria sp. Silwood1]|nr:unnamed protein product [Rotaria sp. Silwood1]CAF4855621.1 unnamed protein product [Rotaria sp. Silwood1]
MNYRGIGLRYLDDDFKLLSFVLGCYFYDAPAHSAAHFGAFVDDKLQEYNLQLDSSKFVVCDNEMRMLAACRDQCTRVSCSDQYLNKQLQHAFELNEIHTNKSTIENVNCETAQNIFLQVKKIVTNVRRSHRQQELSMKLQIYSETRFNGAMTMLDIFRKMFYELPLVLTNTKSMDNYNLIVKKSLDDICCFLQPFEEVIEALSEDHQPTLHRVTRRRKTIWLITTEHRLATILHPKLRNFESCYDEKENSIPALKLPYDKCQLNISSSFSSLLHSN